MIYIVSGSFLYYTWLGINCQSAGTITCHLDLHIWWYSISIGVSSYEVPSLTSIPWPGRNGMAHRQLALVFFQKSRSVVRITKMPPRVKKRSFPIPWTAHECKRAGGRTGLRSSHALLSMVGRTRWRRRSPAVACSTRSGILVFLDNGNAKFETMGPLC